MIPCGQTGSVKLTTRSKGTAVRKTGGGGRGGEGGEEGEGAHSRGRPQEEHPDGPPLFVRVLGTPLRPGGTQGGVIHPQLTPPLPHHGTQLCILPTTEAGEGRGMGGGEGDRGKRARPVTNQKRLGSNLKRILKGQGSVTDGVVRDHKFSPANRIGGSHPCTRAGPDRYGPLKWIGSDHRGGWGAGLMNSRSSSGAATPKPTWCTSSWCVQR